MIAQLNFVKLPVIMVSIGGIVTFIILLIIVYAGLHFRYNRDALNLGSSFFYDLSLIAGCCAIFLVGFYGAVKLF